MSLSNIFISLIYLFKKYLENNKVTKIIKAEEIKYIYKGIGNSYLTFKPCENETEGTNIKNKILSDKDKLFSW